MANPFEKIIRLRDDSSLAALLNRVLAYIETFKSLMTISEDVSDHFDFFSRVIWPEIAETISENLGGVIFAAGRPDELHTVSRTLTPLTTALHHHTSLH